LRYFYEEVLVVFEEKLKGIVLLLVKVVQAKQDHIIFPPKLIKNILKGNNK